MTGTSTAAPAVTTTVTAGIATIEISNPARRNALSPVMVADLADALRSVGTDPGVRVVVLRGAGDQAFVSGADVSRFGAGSEQPMQLPADEMNAMFALLREVPVPVIARIHGYCLGAGVALALNADLRCGDTRAVLGIPAARLGLGYPIEQTSDLVATVGSAVAGDLLYTGRRLDAGQAQTVGLLDRVAEPDRLGEVVDDIATTIAANAPLSVRAAKAAIRSVRRSMESAPDLDEVRRGALAQIARCATSSDLHEGAAAFLAKRAPRFTGH